VTLMCYTYLGTVVLMAAAADNIVQYKSLTSSQPLMKVDGCVQPYAIGTRSWQWWHKHCCSLCIESKAAEA
jgi:hypothetical protein